MKFLTGTLGRLLFSIPFVAFGVGHLTNAQQMAGMVPAFIPGGVLWVYVTGVAMLLAVVAINLRRHDQLAALLLSLMVLILAFTVQLPGMTKEVAATDALGQVYKMTAMVGFFKDLGLAGGALLVAAAAKPKQA